MVNKNKIRETVKQIRGFLKKVSAIDSAAHENLLSIGR